MSKVEFLQGQLERLFELDGLMALSSELLGLEPAEVGDTDAKGTFARALVRHAEKHDGLTLLAEAVRISADESDDLVEQLPLVDHDDELAVGEEVRGFHVLRQLERGPLATLYSAERLSPSNGHTERVQLAVFHRELSRDRIGVWRLLRAARSLRTLRDSGLAGIFDAGTLADGRVVVATEPVPGQTLAHRVERSGPLTTSELRGVARTLLRALGALHDRGHMHGYIRAEHVLIVRPQSGSAQSYGVLTDLATARLLERADEPAWGVLRVVGDPRTLAPEVARGKAADARSDVYSMACVFYYAVTGLHPFEGATPVEQLVAHVYEEPLPPSERAPQLGIPAELDQILARALSKNPDERYQTARELSEALDAQLRLTDEHGLDAEALSRAIDQLREQPADDARAAALEALVAPFGAWTEAVDAFLEAAKMLDDLEALDAKKALLFRSARILVDELGDRAEAERTYRAILDLDAADAQAHNAIEELYRATGDHEALVGLLLDRLDSETSPTARAAILREVGGLYESELRSPDNALLAYTQVLSEDAGDERVRRSVERLATSPEQLGEAIAALHERIVISSDRPAHAAALSVIVGEWYAERLGRPEAALPYLQGALRVDPAHEGALEALTKLYRKAEAWDELVSLLLQRADAARDPAQKRDFQAEAAKLAYTQLGDAALAERTLAGVLREDPTHPTALPALEEVYKALSDLPKLTALLERQLKELRGAPRFAALCELAELYAADPEKQERAIELAKEALDAEPKQQVPYKLLERIYARRGDHDELGKVLEALRDQATTPHQRAQVLERLGALYEESLDDAARAAESFEQIIEIAPGHEVANEALTRLYRKLHRFDDLAQTYDRYAKGAESSDRKVELLMQAARVLMADIGSPERAAFVCERVLALSPNHPEALALTARIKALAGDNLAAIDALELLIDGEQESDKKADLLVRAGQMLESHEDLDGAIERYKTALDVAPGYEAALGALGRLYERRGDVQGEAELLLRRVELESDPREQARRLIALGKLRLEKLKDKALAADAYERASELDPESLEPLLGLGQIALSEQRWEDASAYLEPLLEHTTELPSALALEVLVGAGDAFREQGELEKAERAYRSARALKSDDRVVNQRLAELAASSGRFDEARDLYEAVLDAPGAALASSERAELLMKLGNAQLELGQTDHAAASFNAATDLQPDALAPLDALAAVYEKSARTDALARTLERKLELTTEDETRFALLSKLGDLHAELKSRSEAARYYVSALELNADDRNLLSKLMAVYSESKNWARLADVLLRLAKVVDEGALRAKYLHAAAGITASELGDPDAAIEHYEAALNLDPTHEAAFRGLTDCLGKARAWDRLANVYRAHIERRRDALSAEELAALYDKLGSIYLERVHRIEPAVEAYEAALELDPDDRGRLERLVELYHKNPARFADRAIAAHEKLLEQNAYRVESYRALRKLYTQLQRRDEAWNLCQALRCLNMAEPEEEAFYKRHRVPTAAEAQDCISEELWQEYLVLPEQDEVLTRMFALIQPAAVVELAQAPEAFGVDPEHLIDCENVEAVMPRMLHYAAGVALIPLPPVFYRPHDPGGVSFLFTSPPALGLGRGALRNAPDQALAFFAGRQLSYFRPGHYMRQLLPTGGALRSWLLAAIRLANPRFPVPDAMREQVERNHTALEGTLHVPQQQALTSLVAQLLRDQPELDLKRWALAVDLAADRLGFVLANSLEAAVAMVRASPAESSFASERDRLKQLYTYAVSPQYFALRKALGVTID